MLKLKLKYSGHLMRKADSLEKILMLGKIEGRRRRRWQDEMVGWHHQLNGHEFEQTLGDGRGREAWRAAVHGVAASDVTEWPSSNKNTSGARISPLPACDNQRCLQTLTNIPREAKWSCWEPLIQGACAFIQDTHAIEGLTDSHREVTPQQIHSSKCTEVTVTTEIFHHVLWCPWPSVFQVKTRKWGWMLWSGAVRKSAVALKGRKQGATAWEERDGAFSGGAVRPRARVWRCRWAGRKHTGTEEVRELSLVSWTLWGGLVRKGGVMGNTAGAGGGVHTEQGPSHHQSLLSEASQADKDKYHTMNCVCGV